MVLHASRATPLVHDLQVGEFRNVFLHRIIETDQSIFHHGHNATLMIGLVME